VLQYKYIHNILLFYTRKVQDMAPRTYEQQIADYDAQIARIKSRRQAAIARHSQTERKCRNHATFVAGGLVMRCFEDGWQSVDWQALEEVIEGNRAIFASKTTNKLPTKQAAQRLRSWERSRREKPCDSDE